MYVKLDQYSKTQVIEVTQGYGNFLETYAGWDIIGEYTETVIETRELYNNRNGSYDKQLVPVYKTRWVLGYRGSLAEQAVKEKTEAKQQAYGIEKQLDSFKKETEEKLKDLNKEIADLKYSNKSYQDRYDSATKERHETVQKMRLMEEDIAKVRKAIGDLQFNNIIGVK